MALKNQRECCDRNPEALRVVKSSYKYYAAHECVQIITAPSLELPEIHAKLLLRSCSCSPTKGRDAQPNHSSHKHVSCDIPDQDCRMRRSGHRPKLHHLREYEASPTKQNPFCLDLVGVQGRTPTQRLLLPICNDACHVRPQTPKF